MAKETIPTDPNFPSGQPDKAPVKETGKPNPAMPSTPDKLNDPQEQAEKNLNKDK